MLIEFSVGNYRSFKEKVTFSMVAANLVSQDKNLDINNVFAVDKELSLVKSAAIYGANASGKSRSVESLKPASAGRLCVCGYSNRAELGGSSRLR